MNKIKRYIDEQFKEIPDSEQKETVKQEIIENLNEKVIDLVAQGKAEEDAINKAIVDFGDIEEIKRELEIEQPDRSERTKSQLRFSLWGSALIIAPIIFTNLYYNPGNYWFFYPVFAIMWWPLAMYFRKNR